MPPLFEAARETEMKAPRVGRKAMRALQGLLIVAVVVSGAEGITWDFDTAGDTQGWVAMGGHEGLENDGPARLPGTVADGVWRVRVPVSYDPAVRPSVRLRSPVIGHDSGLFDQVRIRFRVVHSNAPYAGYVMLHWRNEHNRMEPIGVPAYSARADLEVITGRWQEVVIGGLGAGVDVEWEGELVYIRVWMSVMDRQLEWPVSPAAVAEAVEVDWIELTGVGEQVEGGFPPPEPVRPSRGGRLFSTPAFEGGAPWGLGCHWPSWQQGGLGDMDGDGAVDVIAFWSRTVVREGIPVPLMGWVQGMGDGQGHFRWETNVRELSDGKIVAVDAGDLDGDGVTEAIVNVGHDYMEVLKRRAEGWQAIWERQQVYLRGVGDADGDGIDDLWYREKDGDALLLHVLLGGKRFPADELRLGLRSGMTGRYPGQLVHGVGPQGVTGVLWVPPLDELAQGYKLAYLTQAGDVAEEHLGIDVPPGMVLGAGDLDADGDVDLLACGEDWQWVDWERGLRIVRRRPAGAMEALDWQPPAVPVKGAAIADVNGDGINDVVFVDGNIYAPAVVVALGQADALPEIEGRYPLSDGGGGPILIGDVNGDGRPDLVVLEPQGFAGGGVHVLLNQGTVTAVTGGMGTGAGVEGGSDADGASAPGRLRLGAAYPNPFNPRTVIPVLVPPGAGPVHLQVYDILGRPVRRLVSGNLDAGGAALSGSQSAPGGRVDRASFGGRDDVSGNVSGRGGNVHRIPWDGRDATGRLVAPGVYLYRLQAGGRTHCGKMVKVE